jgi:hypothetical protein
MEDGRALMEEDTHCMAFKSIFTEMMSFMQEVLNCTNPEADDLTEEIIWSFFDHEMWKKLIGLPN